MVLFSQLLNASNKQPLTEETVSENVVREQKMYWMEILSRVYARQAVRYENISLVRTMGTLRQRRET